jgi:hypothetical protein
MNNQPPTQQEPSLPPSGEQNLPPQAPEQPKSKKKKWVIITAILLVLLLAAGAAAYYFFFMPKGSKPAESSGDKPSSSSKPAEVKNRGLYYAVEVSHVEQNNRTWPTLAVYRKESVGAAEEELFQTGGAGSFPIDVVIDPNGQWAVANTESNLAIYDISTKQKKLDTPSEEGKVFSTPVFSQDRQKILAFEMVEGITDATGEVSAVTVDLASLQVNRTVLSSGTNHLVARAWRQDGKVVAGWITYSEFTKPYFVDLTAPSVTDVSENALGFVSASDGTKVAVPTGAVADMSNCLSGDSPTGFKVLDPSTQAELAAYTDGTHAHMLKRFSTDKTKVLLERWAPIGGGDCGASPASTESLIVTLSPVAAQVVANADLPGQGFPAELEWASTPTETTLHYKSDLVKSIPSDKELRAIRVVE